MDRVFDLEDVKPLIDKSYVRVKLTVMERDPKYVADNNPNGMEVLKELGGENQGIPYIAAVDKDGKVLMKPSEGLSDEEIKALVTYMRTFRKK